MPDQPLVDRATLIERIRAQHAEPYECDGSMGKCHDMICDMDELLQAALAQLDGECECGLTMLKVVGDTEVPPYCGWCGKKLKAGAWVRHETPSGPYFEAEAE